MLHQGHVALPYTVTRPSTGNNILARDRVFAFDLVLAFDRILARDRVFMFDIVYDILYTMNERIKQNEHSLPLCFTSPVFHFLRLVCERLDLCLRRVFLPLLLCLLFPPIEGICGAPTITFLSSKIVEGWGA